MVDVRSVCESAKAASHVLSGASTALKNEILNAVATAIEKNARYILAENAKDIDNATSVSSAFSDRLKLTEERVAQMAQGVREVAKLPDPVGEVTESWTTAKGLEISKVRAPLGVIGVIYEARPNVTVDVSALCMKSGNAVVLRGGKDAIHSNRAIFGIMKQAVKAFDTPDGVISDCIGFIDDVTRESTAEFLKMDDFVDVIIPRGGEQLKKYIIANSNIPVIASAGGVCHVYVEKTADLDMANSIVKNAKLSRPTVCNACETLLCDREIAAEFLPGVLGEMKAEKGVEVYGCPETVRIFADAIPADENTYRTEYLRYAISVKVVDGVREAVEHINRYGTRHSEAIVTEDKSAADYFTKNVDAAAVYVNASTRFTDGFEYGFGAEIAISTQKLHARGPLGLKQLTSEKYVVHGNGQIR